MGDYTQQDLILIVALFSVLLTIVLLLVVIILSVKMRSLRKNYNRLTAGSEGMHLGEVVSAIQDQVSMLRDGASRMQSRIETLEARMKKMNGRVGIHRYNAFHDKGSDLSFSIAFLNDAASGLVLTGIHSRDDTYIYAKPLVSGESKYTLSPEERQAIEMAMKPQA